MNDKTVVDLTRDDDQESVEDNAPTPRMPHPVPDFVSVVLPAPRRQDLAKLPAVDLALPMAQENAFSRDFMSAALGGNIQTLIAKYVWRWSQRIYWLMYLQDWKTERTFQGEE